MISSSSSRLKEVTCSIPQDKELKEQPSHSNLNCANKQTHYCQHQLPGSYRRSVLTVPERQSVRRMLVHVPASSATGAQGTLRCPCQSALRSDSVTC